MDLRILMATKQAASIAADCGENAMFALVELENACADYDGTAQASDRIHRATESLSARAAAFSRCVDAAYDNACNICED